MRAWEITVSRKSQDRPEHVGDMIHVDVVGPILPVGFNGHRWGLLVMDGRTQAWWGYTFKHKDKASVFLRRFIVDMKTQYSIEVKVIRLDNGTEYGGQKLLHFVQERGSKLKLTVLYTPEQDGIAEQSF